jgi:hypothetical protein
MNRAPSILLTTALPAPGCDDDAGNGNSPTDIGPGMGGGESLRLCHDDRDSRALGSSRRRHATPGVRRRSEQAGRRLRRVGSAPSSCG